MHLNVGIYICRSESLYTVLKVLDVDSLFDESLSIPSCTTVLQTSKVGVADVYNFFQMEQLCTVVNPNCGACHCGHCPVPGYRYSYNEETELKMIKEKLWYDSMEGKWITGYPDL